MNKARTLFLFCIFASAVLYSCLSHAAVTLDFNQVDFYQDGALSVSKSEWGEFNIRYDQGSSLQWINVVADPGTANARWIVQNNPLLPSSLTGTAQYTGTSYFDLGIARGTPLSSLNIGYVVSSAPASVAPVAFDSTGTVSLGSAQNIINNGVPSGIATLGSPSNGSLNWGVEYLGVTAHWQKNMPNVTQETNWCGPGAAANSIHWLNNQLNLGITQTLTETQTDLAAGMDNNNDGNWDDKEVEGKLQYIADNDLPLEVHYVGGVMLPTVGNFTDPNGNGTARNDGPVTWEWIEREKAKGQDIELMTNTHWVVMEGFISWDNIHLIAYRDDPFQHGPATTADEQDIINDRHVWTYYLEGSTNIGNGNETLQAAVAESPVPEPATMLLVGIGLAGIGYFRMRRARQ